MVLSLIDKKIKPECGNNHRNFTRDVSPCRDLTEQSGNIIFSELVQRIQKNLVGRADFNKISKGQEHIFFWIPRIPAMAITVINTLRAA